MVDPNDLVSDWVREEMDHPLTVTGAMCVFEYVDSAGNRQLLLAQDGISTAWSKRGMLDYLEAELTRYADTE